MALHEALMKFEALELDFVVVLAQFAVLAMYNSERRSQIRLGFAMLDRNLDLLWIAEWLGELGLKEREGLNL